MRSSEKHRRKTAARMLPVLHPDAAGIDIGAEESYSQREPGVEFHFFAVEVRSETACVCYCDHSLGRDMQHEAGDETTDGFRPSRGNTRSRAWDEPFSGTPDRIPFHETGQNAAHYAADARFFSAGCVANAASLPPSRNCRSSRRPKSSIIFAMSPVHPVWWLAPRPAPLSPWKYSKKRR